MTTNNELTPIQKIAVECIERWGEDHKTIHFSNKLGKFVSQLDSESDLGPIFLELVKNYNYYSLDKVREYLIIIYEEIICDLKLNPQDTIYSRIEDDSKIDSSNLFLEEFKVLNNVSNHFSHDIGKLSLHSFDRIGHLVFIDDFIGSGNTIIKFFERNKGKLLKVQCYIFCIEAMEEGLSDLDTFFKSHNFKCTICCKNIRKKAFASNYIFETHNNTYEKLLKEFEISLWGYSNDNILGYNNSQALLSFSRNTPNNTLSSFWFEKGNWTGLFPRDNRKPLFLTPQKNPVKKKGMGKKKMNYNLGKAVQQNGKK